MASLLKKIFSKPNKYKKFNDDHNLEMCYKVIDKSNSDTNININNTRCLSTLPIKTDYHICEQKFEKKDKTQYWATVQISPDLPFFGAFLTLTFTKPNIPHRLLIYVGQPSKDLDNIPSFPDTDKKKIRDLIISFANWPFVNPCPKCSIEGESKQDIIYHAFYTDPNAIAYHYDNFKNSYYHSNSMDTTKTANTISAKYIFLYYAEDETQLGSLYWHEDKLLYNSRIPLDSISDIYIGVGSSFFNKNHIKNNYNSCFSLKTKDGFMLNINLISPIQRFFWLKKLLKIYHNKNVIYNIS